MNEPLPFRELLDELARERVHITVREHLALGRLIQRYDGTSRTQFRDAVAALLGRSDEEVRRIEAAFDRLYPEEMEPRKTPPPVEPPIPISPRQQNTKPPGLWRQLVIVAIAAAGLVLAMAWPEQGRFEGTLHKYVPPPPEPPKPQCPELAWPAPRIEQVPDRELAALGIFCALFVLLTSAIRRGNHRIRAWRHGVWRAGSVSLGGARDYRIAIIEELARDEGRAYASFATALQRAAMERSPAQELDVPRTLRDSIRSFPRIALVHRLRRRPAPIIILEDTAADMRPWRGKIDALVAGLQRNGTQFIRLFFHGDTARVSRVRDGKRTSLASYLRDNPRAPVLVISWTTSHRQQSAAAFTLRLSPVSDENLWPSAMRAEVWPITYAGLIDASRAVSTRRFTRIPGEPELSASRRDAQLFAALLSLVRAPTFELAEYMRWKLFSTAPESLLLAARPIIEGRREDAGPTLAKLDARGEMQRQLRELLVSLLDANEPARGSAAHLRWRHDRAIHGVAIGSEAAANELRELASQPLADELLYHASASSLDVSPKLRREVEANVNGKGRPSAIFWPHPVAIVVALLVAALSWWPTGTRHDETYRVQLKAYVIEKSSLPPAATDPEDASSSDSYALRGEWSSLPDRVTLYRDQTPLRELVVGNAFALASPGCYQAGILDGDTQYVSNAVRVGTPEPEPEPLPSGEVLVQIKGCTSCHSLDGKASVGPTFAGIASRNTIFVGGKRLVDVIGTGKEFPTRTVYFIAKTRNGTKLVVQGFASGHPAVTMTPLEEQAIATFLMTLQNTPPVAITGVSPTSGRPGAQITIIGSGFTATQRRVLRVNVGPANARFVRFKSDTEMVVITSASAPEGNASIVVEFDPGGTITGSKRFTFRAPADPDPQPTPPGPGAVPGPASDGGGAESPVRPPPGAGESGAAPPRPGEADEVPMVSKCPIICTGEYPGARLSLSAGRTYDVVVIGKALSDAESFTIHKTSNGERIIDVVRDEVKAVVRGPEALSICSRMPNTGGGCATRCASSGGGVATLSTDQYRVTLKVTCQ